MGIIISYFCIKSPPIENKLKVNYKEKSQKQKQQLKNYYLFKSIDTPLINI